MTRIHDPKVGTVALVISNLEKSPQLLEALSDEAEILILEEALKKGEKMPLESVLQHREFKEKEDEDFGDYVEELLSQPFLKPEIQKHALGWLKSRIRIQEFLTTEVEATKIIANYAFGIFLQDPNKQEFFLAGPKAKVKIRIFVVSPESLKSSGPMAA